MFSRISFEKSLIKCFFFIVETIASKLSQVKLGEMNFPDSSFSFLFIFFLFLYLYKDLSLLNSGGVSRTQQ